jgi:hypothetical protein
MSNFKCIFLLETWYRRIRIHYNLSILELLLLFRVGNKSTLIILHKMIFLNPWLLEAGKAQQIVVRGCSVAKCDFSELERLRSTISNNSTDLKVP